MKKKAFFNTRRGGFTLIELLIVVAILAILAAIAIPSYFRYLESARITVSISALGWVGKDIEAFKSQHGAYPSGINFPPGNFTDTATGNPIAVSISLQTLNDKIFSWESYTASGDQYSIRARAIDANHTDLYLTPLGVSRQP